MQMLRTLAVTFDSQISPWELPQFRGAVAQKVGLEHDWFHNHNNETGGYYNRYPLIQYKLNTQGEKMQPMLLCLDHAIEEAQHFFSQPDWGIRIGTNNHAMRIANLQVNQCQLSLTDTPRRYRIHKWKPFNPDNFAIWQATEGLVAQFALLEHILVGNLLSFAEGVGWAVPDTITATITDVQKREWISFKGIKMLAFTLDFTANLPLPNFVGIGKGAGMGYGVVRGQGG